MSKKSTLRKRVLQYFYILLIISSIYGVSYLSAFYHFEPYEAFSVSTDFSCTVKAGPHNATDFSSYKMKCSDNLIAFYHQRLVSGTQYRMQVDVGMSDDTYGINSAIYVVPDYRYNREQYPGYDVFTIQENTSEVFDERISRTAVQYFFIYINPVEIVRPDIDYGLVINYQVNASATIYNAPFFSTYRPYILAYFAFILFSPVIFNLIRNKYNQDQQPTKQRLQDEIIAKELEKKEREKSNDFYRMGRQEKMF